MTAAETIEHLTELVKMQADIIREQANALMQLGAVVTPSPSAVPAADSPTGGAKTERVEKGSHKMKRE